MSVKPQTTTLEQLRAELRGLWQILPGLADPSGRRAEQTKGG